MATRKRAKNDGSLFRMKDGRWAAEISLGYVEGKRKRKRLTGHTQAEVRKKLTKLLGDKDQGLPIASDRLTVGQFLDQWLRDCVRPNLRPKTIRSYEQLVRLHIKPALGRITLVRLTAQDVQHMMNVRLEKGLSPRTVGYIRAVLRRALGQAEKWNLVPRNVATLVDPPRTIKYKAQPLTSEEAKVFVESLKGDRDEALYVLSLSLGLRLGEVLGLRWDDVDFDKGQLRIENALQRVKGTLVLVPTKTEQSRRTLPLPRFVIASLREYRRAQGEKRLMLGSEWHDGGFVFTTDLGRPLDPDNTRRKLKSLLRRAGLREIRFHDLRHSCATFLAARGVPPRVAMDLLGHSEIRTTLEVYSHVMPEMLREATEVINGIFDESIVK